MGMEFESRKRAGETDSAKLAKAMKEIAKLKEEQAAVSAANTERIKDLQNIMADMVEGGAK